MAVKKNVAKIGNKKSPKKKVKRKVKSKRVSRGKVKRKSKTVKVVKKNVKRSIEVNVEKASKERSYLVALAYLFQIVNLVFLGLGSVLSIIIYLLSGKRNVKFQSIQATFIGILISLLMFVIRTDTGYGAYIMDVVHNGIIFITINVAIVLAMVVLAIGVYKNDKLELPLFGHLSKHVTKR